MDYSAQDIEDIHWESLRRLCVLDYHTFVKEAWHIIEPDEPFIDNWHIGLVCEHYEALVRGQILRLIVNMPPGFMKSILGPVMLPAWVWTWRPGWRSLWASYAGPLATRDAVKCRQIIESDWYQERFVNGWQISADQNEKTLFTTTSGGVRQSFGIGAGGLGFRGNLAAADDPNNAQNIHSKPDRDSVIAWHDTVWSQRLNDRKRDALLVTMQRLHQDDLSGHLLRRGGYEHLCLMQEFDKRKAFVTYCNVTDEFGNVQRKVFREDPRTQDGELICPQRFPQSAVDEEKAKGEALFSAQQQQEPVPAGGSIVKKIDFRFARDVNTPISQIAPRNQEWFQGPALEIDLARMDDWLLSVDCKFKDTKDSGSYVSMGVWARKGTDMFRVARRRKRFSFMETIANIKSICEEYPQIRKKLIEDKAQGPAVIEVLHQHVVGLCPREPKGSKEARLYACTPLIEGHHVFLMDGATSNDEFIEEVCAFPNGLNDDQVDEMTMALLEWSPSLATSRASVLCDLSAWGYTKTAA